MFDEVAGLPAHPLIVHMAVVFVPLLCAAAVAYALVPRLRGLIGWAAAGLAIVAPIAAWIATQSGGALATARYQGQIPPAIHDHQVLGDRTFYTSIGLGVVTLVLVYLTGTASGRSRRLPSWVSIALSAVAILLAVVVGYYVVRTGDSGARSVWGA